MPPTMPVTNDAAVLFAAVILVVVFFLIARVAHARQPVALAFGMMPVLLAIAASNLANAAVPI